VRPPREHLIRAVAPVSCGVRSADDGDSPILFGHFARFNEWTEIDSVFEGHFLERVAPGAFAKTFREQAGSIRCLFEHGRDPQIGNKILGPVLRAGEDEEGAFYEVALLDTDYVRELLPGLEQGLYGASFRFSVVRDEFVQRPPRSDRNPQGLPERTLLELRLHEFGPVTFPAYAGATAGVRSLTDEFLLGRLLADGDPRRLAGALGVQPEPLARAIIAGLREHDEERAAIPPHDTPVVDEPWDKNEQLSKLPSEQGVLREMHAWVDSAADPDLKGSYKFPHHMVSDADGTPGNGDERVGAANVNAVRDGLARLGQAQIPDDDREGVRRHLQQHLDAFNNRSAPDQSAGATRHPREPEPSGATTRAISRDEFVSSLERSLDSKGADRWNFRI